MILAIMNLSQVLPQVWAQSDLVFWSRYGLKIFKKVADIRTILNNSEYPCCFLLTPLTVYIWSTRPRWLNWMRRPTGDQEVAGSTPCRGRQHSFVEIDHEIFSTAILSLQLIQEGHFYRFLVKECVNTG